MSAGNTAKQDLLKYNFRHHGTKFKKKKILKSLKIKNFLKCVKNGKFPGDGNYQWTGQFFEIFPRAKPEEKIRKIPSSLCNFLYKFLS